MEDAVLPFDDPPPAVVVSPPAPATVHEARLVGRLRALYGPGPPGATCGACRHLYARHYTHTVYKCELGPHTSSATTDWRRRWAACGMFQPAAR